MTTEEAGKRLMDTQSRGRALGIMLGCAALAEEIIDDGRLRYHGVVGRMIRSPRPGAPLGSRLVEINLRMSDLLLRLWYRHRAVADMLDDEFIRAHMLNSPDGIEHPLGDAEIGEMISACHATKRRMREAVESAGK